MKNLIYVIAVALLLVWAIGVIGFDFGGVIHALLVIAIVVIMIRLIQGKKAV